MLCYAGLAVQVLKLLVMLQNWLNLEKRIGKQLRSECICHFYSFITIFKR